MIIDSQIHNNNVKKLADLYIGDKGKIVSLNIKDKDVRRHLLDMGVVKGSIIEVKNIAPLGDPVKLRVRDYEICIRKSELIQIDVEVI